MSTQKWRWLVGYHFFREQYLTRNFQYILLTNKLRDLETEFEESTPQIKLPYHEHVWAECFQTEEYYSTIEMTTHQIRLIKRGISITNKLKKMGASFSTGHRIETNSLLDHIAKGHHPHEISPMLADSFTPREGTYRVSHDALRAVSFKEKGFATVRFDLSKPLPTQFVKSYKTIAQHQYIDKLSNANAQTEIDRLEEIDFATEQFVITKDKKVTYSPRGDLPRSIGLWLYDYCDDNDCGGPSSINKLRETDYLNRLSLDSKQDREFQRWLTGTRKCVEAANVYALT